jgi:hypothetical protein
MNSPDYAVGDLVKVTSGSYADAVGVVEDLPDECSVIRIQSNGDRLYAYKDAVTKLPSPQKSVRSAIKK